MNRVFTALATVVLAGMPSLAQAGITATVTPVTTNVPAGFTGYIITLTSATGVISAVDFDTSGEAGKAFSNLTLHQRWLLVTDPDSGNTTNPPTPVGTAVIGPDSHFIYKPADIVPFGAAYEDNSGSGSPLSVAGIIYGLGTTLSGSWAYSYDAATKLLRSGPTMDVAYLVIKNGTLPANGILATPYVTEFVDNFTVPTVPVIIAVPEPTSFALLGVGALALIARRRKA